MGASKAPPLALEPPASQAMSAEGQAPFNVSFWACGADPLICCSGLWLPCFVYANNTADLEGHRGNYWRNCCLFWGLPVGVRCLTDASLQGLAAAAAPQAALACVALAGALAAAAGLAAIAAPRRRQLREQNGLAADPCPDFWAWFCCPALSLCQEAAHLQARKEAQLAAIRGYQRVPVVVPPEAQSMKG